MEDGVENNAQTKSLITVDEKRLMIYDRQGLHICYSHKFIEKLHSASVKGLRIYNRNKKRRKSGKKVTNQTYKTLEVEIIGNHEEEDEEDDDEEDDEEDIKEVNESQDDFSSSKKRNSRSDKEAGYDTFGLGSSSDDDAPAKARKKKKKKTTECVDDGGRQSSSRVAQAKQVVIRHIGIRHSVPMESGIPDSWQPRLPWKWKHIQKVAGLSHYNEPRRCNMLNDVAELLNANMRFKICIRRWRWRYYNSMTFDDEVSKINGDQLKDWQ
eukprot:scaffold22800_cov72-Attheya_sp.AAC.1